MYSFGATTFLEGIAVEQQTSHPKCLPKIVKFGRNTRIKSAAAGTVHVITLTETGEVLSWSNNRRGQLGTANVLSITVPQRIALVDPRCDESCTVSSVNAYDFVSCAVTTSGKFFMWGLVLPTDFTDADHDGIFYQRRFFESPNKHVY